MDFYCKVFCYFCFSVLALLIPIVIALWAPDFRDWLGKRAIRKMDADEIERLLNDKAKREIAANTLHELGLKVAKR